ENLQFVIGCLILLTGLSIYFATREVRRTAGVVAAVFLTAGLFLFIRRFIGSTMSEMLGLPLGTIGFALLWSGAVRQRIVEGAAGILLLSLGLFARAGAFILLPLLIFWAGWGFRDGRKYNWKAVIISGVAAGLGFLINSIIYNTLAGSNSSSMANFSYTLYGLVVGGKGWKQYPIDHPDVINMIEPFQSRAIYLYAWEAFKTNPFATVQGAFRYWGTFFTFDWYGAFGYIEGASSVETFIGRGFMAILSLGGLIYAVINYKKPVVSMVLAGVLGIILSVPFVPPLDAEIRTHAAGIPWFISLGMFGIIGIQSIWKKSFLQLPSDVTFPSFSGELWSMAACFVILVFVAPLLVHGFVLPREIPTMNSCQQDEVRVVTVISKGSYINVLSDAALEKSMVPNVRYTDFNKSMHDSPMFRMALKMFPVGAGSSFFTGYNWSDRQFEDILGPTELFEKNQGWVELCGWREVDATEYGFFHAETARQLRP
ncbi:MAG TPA: hypothetical protein VF338_00495, partial [Leptolinea sp.]